VLEGGADNSPFRRGKQSVYEGGVRVPSLLYWRGRLRPVVSEKMVTVEDVLPTLLELTRSAASEQHFDGISQWPFIDRDEAVLPRDYVTQAQGYEAFYRYPWKLIKLSSGEDELYNLEQDPTEKSNLAAHQPELIDELNRALSSRERGESVHIPLYKSIMNMDFFGGKEIYPPWAEQVK